VKALKCVHNVPAKNMKLVEFIFRTICLLSVKNATKQRNLGTIAYKIKCKWGKQDKKAELGLGQSTNESVCSIESL
jgi:hypothetical protein